MRFKIKINMKVFKNTEYQRRIVNFNSFCVPVMRGVDILYLGIILNY